MFLIVGLGNPGEKYRNTRHNIGFMIIDKFRKENNFPALSFSKKFNSLISKGEIGTKKIILAKPQTFMNNSGLAVRVLIKNLKRTSSSQARVKIKNLLVVHDDIDLPFGKIRISQNRGSAGHKGVESIIKELKTKNFIRLRIGIQPFAGKPKKPEGFVLKNFDKEEEKTIKNMIEMGSFTIPKIINRGAEKAMNEINA